MQSHLPLATALPSTSKCLMTFSAQSTITEGAAAGGALYQYRLNGVYDPDFSGVGTTATGYTTYSAAFGFYRVLRATVRLTASATTTALTGFADVILAPTAVTVFTSSPTAWRSIPGAHRMQVVPLAQGGHNLVRATVSYDLHTIFRVTKQQYMIEDDYAAITGASPGLPAILNVMVVGVGSANPYSLTYTIDITYEVEWMKPTPLTL